MQRPGNTDMDIRIITSLDTDDEDRMAGATLDAIVSLLTDLPASYAVRIETGSGRVLQHTNLPGPSPRTANVREVSPAHADERQFSNLSR
jgi:hypothetical protein